MGKKLLNVVRIILTLLFLYLVFSKIDPRGLIVSLKGADKLMLSAAALAVICNTVLMTVRVRTLFSVFNVPLKFSDVLRYHLIGMFFNQVLPTAVGGDAVKGYKLGKAVGNVSSGLILTLIDRLIGLLTMILFLLLAMLIGGAEYLDGNALLLVGIFVVFAITATFVIFSSRVTRFVYRIFLKPFEGKLGFMKHLKESYNFFLQTKSSRGVYLTAGALSFLAQLILVTGVFFMGRSLGVTLSLKDYFIIMPIIFVISMLPISVGGFGVREQAFVSLFGLYGVSKVTSLAVALLYVGFFLLMCLPGGILYLLGEKEKIDGK